MTTTQHTQQQRVKAPSGALPSDGLSRFVRAGAWAARRSPGGRQTTPQTEAPDEEKAATRE
jgi:hypothetical protein